METGRGTADDRWRQVFENSAVGMVLTDLDGRIMAANTAYQGMVGYTEQQLHALNILDITHENDRAAASPFS